MFRKIKKFIKSIKKKDDYVELPVKKESKKIIPIKKKSFKSILDEENKTIETYKDFLNEFGNNNQQKRAVISDQERILVLAGAGSGKTKVLTKRIIHLVKNKNVPMHNILALTFTKEATNEMVRRIAKELELKTELVRKYVKTFHAFSSSILKQNEQFDIINQDLQRELIEDIVSDFRDNDEIMTALYDYIKDNILEKIKSSDNPEYYIKNKPEDFGKKRFRTIQGIEVRSKSERDIADFLTINNIEWEYEKEVNFGEGAFKPDFTLSNGTFIEHWCYNDNTPEISQINKNNYLKTRRWKEEQYKKYNKHLISIEEHEMLDWFKLQKRLKKEINKEIQERDVLELLKLSQEHKKAYEKFIDELVEIINLIKSRLQDIEDVEKNISKEKKEKILNFYKVLIPVMKEYNSILNKKDYSKKDFNDLIKDAVRLLQKNEERRKYYQDKIKYLLVDEYQDVSYGDVELLKLLTTKNTNLFCVGDDWQSIYGWRGSNVSYILNFEKDFGDCEKIILPINYRSSNNIVKASNHFIQQNPRQIPKEIECCEERKTDNSKIVQVNAVNDFTGARWIMGKVSKLIYEHPELTINDFLVLYRSSRNSKLYNDTFKKADFKIKTHTIHWSKGTESKIVFVIGLKSGIYGFPNIYADKDIKRVILDIPIEEKDDEERRLFYVAMTRAKDRLYLISEKGNESEYVKQVPEECKFVYVENN